MKVLAWTLTFPLLLFGLVQALSIPHWVEEAKAGVDLSMPMDDFFIKTFGDTASAQTSQLLFLFEAFKSEIHKIEHVLQDPNLATQIAEAFTLQTSKLQAEFTLPVPDETAARHALLTEAIDKTMDVLDAVTEDVGKALKADTAPIRQAFQEARQPVKDIALLAAKTVDDHPCLFELVQFVLVVEVPGFWLLRPLLQMIGFSSKGPTKGSLAAGMQGKVYAGRVPKGSLFSKLQKTGMLRPVSFAHTLAKLGAAAAIADALVFCHLQ